MTTQEGNTEGPSAMASNAWRPGLKSSHQGMLAYSGKSELLSQLHSGTCGLAVTRITTVSEAVRNGNWETDHAEAGGGMGGRNNEV